jgi:hypothetical protein
MIDVDSLAESTWLDGNPRYIPVCRSVYRNVYFVLCPNVKTHVPMIGSYLSKIGHQLHGYVEWLPKIILWVSLGFTYKGNK